MSVNPYPNLPHDKGNVPMQEFPSPIVAKARYAKENSAASSVISVSHDTTAIEIGAATTGAIMRWVTIADTQASVVGAEGTPNFDHFIGPGTVRKFAIPIERQQSNYSSMMGANRLNGLYQRVAVKSVGIGSVLLSEF